MHKDAWLHSLRTDPSPLFTQQLHARLGTGMPSRRPAPSDAGSPRRRATFAAAAVILVAVSIAVPGVRASVAQFIALFRVVHFVPVPVDGNRLDRLQAENLEIGALLGEHVEVVHDPGPPVAMASIADAAAAAGRPLALPQWLPEQTQVLETAVIGERVLRVTADGQRLQQVLDALGIHDLTVPAGLDRQVVNVRVPPVVMIRYEHGNRRTRLFQAATPQLTLPGDIDVQALGEIGLRIMGLSAAEAKQFAHAIDWHSTLVVPVPPNASSFRQVTIGGHLGVLIQHQPTNQSPTSMLLWSTADRVFVLVSIAHLEHVLAIADSVR